MVETEANLQEQLRAAAAVLTAVRSRLANMCSSLPEEEPEPEGEGSGPGLQSVVSCILTDAIDPAIRDLLRAAEQESTTTLASLSDMEGAELSLTRSRFGRELQRRLAEQARSAREAE